MNKALQRRGIEVVFVHGVGDRADHIIKDMKGNILLQTRQLNQVFNWVNNVNAKVVRVERDYDRGQSKIRNKGIRPIPINKTRQYAEHHEDTRQHKRLVSRVSSKFGVDNEVAEKLLPFIDAIPDFRSSDEIDWESLDEKAGEALKILSEAEWF